MLEALSDILKCAIQVADCGISVDVKELSVGIRSGGCVGVRITIASVGMSGEGCVFIVSECMRHSCVEKFVPGSHAAFSHAPPISAQQGSRTSGAWRDLIGRPPEVDISTCQSSERADRGCGSHVPRLCSVMEFRRGKTTPPFCKPAGAFLG